MNIWTNNENEEIEANEKKLDDRSYNNRDKRFPTARFSGELNSKLKNKEKEQN